MSSELHALLKQIEAIAAKDAELGRILRAIVDYLATQEASQTLKRSGK